MMNIWRGRGPWAVGVVAGVAAMVLVGVGILRPPGRLDVFLEPAGAVGPDPFLVLESPDLRMGAAEELALSGGVTIRVGTAPGLYGGSGSDHLCDPQLIADFLAEEPAKAAAWASAARVEVDEIDSFLATLTPVRLLADTWVTNHGYRDGEATPRQSILQAGTMVLVDDLGVPRVRCKCGNPLQPPQVPSDLSRVDFIGEPWDGFDPDQLLVIEAADEPVEWFILVRLEDGRLVARPVGTLGDQDVLVDEDGNWIPELDLELPPTAAVGDGPFPLPEVSSAGLEVDYEVDGPCRISGQGLVLESEGSCVLSATSRAEIPWAALDLAFEIEISRLDQEIRVGRIGKIVLGENPAPLAAIADSLLPVAYEVSGPCEIEGNKLVATGVGSCELTVTQAGNDRWAPAEPVTLTIEITDGPPRQAVEITLDLPLSLRLDEGTLTLEATTVPRRPVSYLVAGACGLTGGATLVPETVGDCEVVALATDDDDFQRAVASATVTILPRLQTLGLDSLPRFAVLSDATVPLPARTSAGIDIDYEVSGDCRLRAQGLEFTAVGRCRVVATAEGDAETESVTETVDITISAPDTERQSQTIAFAQPQSLVYGGSGVTLSASASSGLAVALTVTTGDCRLSGSTLLPGDAGRCTVVASQNGDADYEPAESVSRSVTVARVTPTLTVRVSGGSATEMVEGETRTVTGTVSAGPTATVTGTSGPCTRGGPTSVTASGTSAGDCDITVAAPGDTNHNPASTVVTIRVKLRQTVSLRAPSQSIYVGGQVRPQASASSDLPVTLSAGPARVCTLAAGVVAGAGAGTCTVTASQAGNSSYAPASASLTIEVQSRRVPVVTINAPPSMVVGEVATITASSTERDVTITIEATGAACGQRGSSVVAVARGTCTITATHPATAEAEAGSARAAIDITGQSDSISFDCVGSCDVEVGVKMTVAMASRSGLDVTASVSGPCEVLGERNGSGWREVVLAGSAPGTCTISASTRGNAEYEPVSGSMRIDIDPLPASVSFELGRDFLVVGEKMSFDIVHNIPRDVVVARISGSSACDTSIDAAGLNGSVVAVAEGACTVMVTVSGGNYATAQHSDSTKVVLG